MHYVTRRAHRMQKHKFDVMCPGTFFAIPSHPSMKNTVSMFYSLDALECTTWPVNPTECKNTSSRNVTRRVFFVESYLSHMSMKNSASPFQALDAPECTT
jgi:hypothetical protein